MNKIVIVAGDLASGKTTYSEILAKNFGIARFNKDNIKEILGEQIGFHNREENVKLSSATFRLMCHMITRFAEVHQNIILEANFHNEELEVIAKICKQVDSCFLLVHLTADMHELHKRYMYRERSGSRHPVHLSIDLSDYERFEEFILRNRIRIFQDQMIEIDASSFCYQEKTELIDQIAFFLHS